MIFKHLCVTITPPCLCCRPRWTTTLVHPRLCCQICDVVRVAIIFYRKVRPNLAINKMWNFFIFLKNNILLYIILATSLNFIWIIVIENLQNHLIWKEKKIKWFQVLVKISTRNLKKGWCQFQWKMSKLCVVLVHWILCLESLAWCARWAWVNQHPPHMMCEHETLFSFYNVQ